ncbi:proline dehydrogenase [Fulvivirga sp. M361]|uniref:proline dehydrogenase family protein n=1 Tax=Fulvivirga sp. M361 TaxID=2594266 RepID=UPI00117A6047|nr:proline dehydrogenase family protein [Fulvivirga sp. M361]TRX53786.1 proline dehydrogenase [Fulvivirga sp. M361]
MQLKSNVSFDDTSVAFKYKSNRALKKANLLFSVINNPVISFLGSSMVKVGLKLRLPLDFLIKSTVFEHFCGGEAIEECKKTIEALAKYNVGTILDYSVEGEHNEADFDRTMEETIRNIDTAKRHDHIPFCVFKMTGLASKPLLQKVQSGEELDPMEQSAFAKVEKRVEMICQKAFDHQVPILIDAEESWIQEPIDKMAYAMMMKYNQEQPIVYNTYQMYRTNMLTNLRGAFHYAAMNNYHLGAKLVRGAYMEKERERAEEMNYPSPIQPNKAATDDQYDKALAFCVDNKQRISVINGSHNEYSNYYLALLMEKHGMKNNDKRVWFAQLYGMSENISFNLAKAGYNVAKYVPYGPVKAVMPYLFRRAEENTSVAGQSSRELSLIRKELKRRKLA